jgi:hypothetical protein
MSELYENDKKLTKELGIKSLARLVGYTEMGEPIELVYDTSENEYGWHIGGEYLKQASQRSIELYAEQFNRCPLV